MENDLALVTTLLKLVQDEKEYEIWYNKKHAELYAEMQAKKFNCDYYDFIRNNRAPNKANTRDALRIIARLSFKMAKRR